MVISQEIHQSDFGRLKFIPRWICTSLFINDNTHHVSNGSCCGGAAQTSRYLLFFHEYNKNKSNLFLVSTWHFKKKGGNFPLKSCGLFTENDICAATPADILLIFLRDVHFESFARS